MPDLFKHFRLSVSSWILSAHSALCCKDRGTYQKVKVLRLYVGKWSQKVKKWHLNLQCQNGTNISQHGPEKPPNITIIFQIILKRVPLLPVKLLLFLYTAATLSVKSRKGTNILDASKLEKNLSRSNQLLLS